MLQRYTMKWVEPKQHVMVPDQDGEFVKADEALARIAELEAENARLVSELMEASALNEEIKRIFDRVADNRDELSKRCGELEKLCREAIDGAASMAAMPIDEWESRMLKHLDQLLQKGPDHDEAC